MRESHACESHLCPYRHESSLARAVQQVQVQSHPQSTFWLIVVASGTRTGFVMSDITLAYQLWRFVEQVGT